MKYLSIIRYVLMAVSVLVIALYFVGVVPEVDMMLQWTYLLLGITVAAVLLLPLFVIAKNPKSAVRSLVGLVIIAVVVSIAYALSSSEPVQTTTKLYENPTELLLSDTGLITTYLAIGITIISIVVTEVINAFK